jgi:hypothetical protein
MRMYRSMTPALQRHSTSVAAEDSNAKQEENPATLKCHCCDRCSSAVCREDEDLNRFIDRNVRLCQESIDNNGKQRHRDLNATIKIRPLLTMKLA